MMYFYRPEEKYRARRQLANAWPPAWKVTLVYLLLTGVLTYMVEYVVGNPFSDTLYYLSQGYGPSHVYRYVFGGPGVAVALFLSILMGFYNTVVRFGYVGYTLHVSRSERAGYGSLIEGFGIAGRIILLDVVMSLFIFLWSMLFLLPGIIAAYRYSQAVYCLLDDPDIGPMEALRRSTLLMRGRKLELFTLQLSFFGWSLLTAAWQGILSFLLDGLYFGVEPVDALLTLVGLLLSYLPTLWLLPYTNVTFARFYNFLVGFRVNGEDEGDNETPDAGNSSGGGEPHEPEELPVPETHETPEPPKSEPRGPKLEF